MFLPISVGICSFKLLILNDMFNGSVFAAYANSGVFKLGINSAAFNSSGSGRQAGAPNLFDSNFDSTVFPGVFYLPAGIPGNGDGLPSSIDKFKYLTIQDSTGQMWYIPAYGGR